VRRLSLNRLRSAYRRREESVGARTGDVGAGARAGADDDPADRITLDDQVQQALAVVLDRLSPAERTAFVLHDVFGFPFDAVGEIVGRTAAACRQLASRARRSVQADAPPLAPAPTSTAVATDATRTAERRRELAERFAAACAGGDIGELMAVLDPDVAGDAVLVGGRLLNHVEGAAAVASRIVALLGPDSGATLVPLDLEGEAGVVALDRGRFVAAIRLDEQDGRVHHIHTFVVRPVPAATD
jgi:RNA polymerase sigma-70 factor (ECF subfamily)